MGGRGIELSLRRCQRAEPEQQGDPEIGFHLPLLSWPAWQAGAVAQELSKRPAKMGFRVVPKSGTWI
jgi:hypothetical protein